MTDTGGRGGEQGDAGGPHAGTPRCTCPAPELGHYSLGCPMLPRCAERAQVQGGGADPSTSAGGSACPHGLVDATTGQCLRCGHIPAVGPRDERLLRAMAAMLAVCEDGLDEEYEARLLAVGRKAMEEDS